MQRTGRLRTSARTNRPRANRFVDVHRLGFIGVQLAVFGHYMGATFASNHKGMPIVPADVKLDFLSKQVRTSRNITGGWWATILMGGLNYQIEHHLFPSMHRPHLRAARTLVREHCRSNDVPYVETTLLSSYRTVIDYPNRVGLTARDPFDWPAGKPTTAQLTATQSVGC